MIDRKVLADAIRVLSMDAVETAKSGHPGMPMGMAEIGESIWRHHLRHNPSDPKWPNRDRFVVSNGHGSMLLYALLHLSGYDLSIAELKRFRQLGSKTPGHPEYQCTVGVETTTGPLGQGLSNAVGMALAEKLLAAEFNEPSYDVIDHNTYVLIGDGCLMEGISHEACSLAGVLGLSKLTVIYDDNGVSIDSDKADIKNWFEEDIPQRFESYNWHVIPGIDGHNPEQVDRALQNAAENTDKPTIICCKTVIGKGSPNKSGTGAAHGAPLGEEEVNLTKKRIDWDLDAFVISEAIYDEWSFVGEGKRLQKNWEELFKLYSRKYPSKAEELTRRLKGNFPENWESFKRRQIERLLKTKVPIATRKSSQEMIEELSSTLPELLGGSADLAASNLTMHSKSKPVGKQDSKGDYVFYGVREFGMGGVMNGLALHGGLIPFGGTFLVFSDYARNALRMAALMGLRVIYVFTHDSIGLGEDGPTHQPIEHASSLRLIPNMSVWRPCDSFETAVAWMMGLERVNGPTSILLSRQKLPQQKRDKNSFENVRRGGYVLIGKDNPNVVIIATGSEVKLAMEAQKVLDNQGVNARVVSMPSSSVFDLQEDSYRKQVLPDGVPIVAVEAGVTGFWYKYVNSLGDVLGIDSFGESAPGGHLFEHFGFTVENLVARVKKLL